MGIGIWCERCILLALLVFIGLQWAAIVEMVTAGSRAEAVIVDLIGSQCAQDSVPRYSAEDWSQPTIAVFASHDDCAEWYWYYRGPRGGWSDRYPGKMEPEKYPG